VTAIGRGPARPRADFPWGKAEGKENAGICRVSEAWSILCEIGDFDQKKVKQIFLKNI
jgi:hypothetical protein